VKWSVHRYVAAKVLGRSEPLFFRIGVLHGVVEPDRRPDYVVKPRFQILPHHLCTGALGRVQREIVKYYVDLAVYYYATGRLYRAGVALGRALHYVQDGVIPSLGQDYAYIHELVEEVVSLFIRGEVRSEGAQRLLDRMVEVSKAVLREFYRKLGRLKLLGIFQHYLDLAIAFLIVLTPASLLVYTDLTPPLALLLLCLGSLRLLFLKSVKRKVSKPAIPDGVRPALT